MNQNKSNTLKGSPIVGMMLLYCLIGFPCHAQESEQEQWTTGRRIQDIKVEIVRERRITLPTVNRNFEKIPPRFTESIKPTLTYNFKYIPFTPPAYTFSIRPMRLKQEAISKIYGNFLSIGFGNYLSPYLEGCFNSKRNKKHLYGAQIYHRSAFIGPVDEGNSANFDTYFKAFGTVYGRLISGRARVTYDNKVGYFYGYAPGQKVNRDTIRQIYHVAALGATINKTKTGRFNFVVNTDFSYLIDHYHTRETELSVNVNTDYAFSKKSAISLVSDYFLINRQDADSNENLRHLLKVKPAFTFIPIENMLLTAGVNAIMENDTIHDRQFHIYPHIRLQYTIINDLKAYAAVTGDFDKISLHTLYAENFWVNTNLDIFNTERSYEFLIGLAGKLGRRVNLEAGFSRVDLKAWYMYRNARRNTAKFDVIYDNAEQINFFATARYEKNKKITLSFRGDYFLYTMEHATRPWHKPQYQIAFNAFFDIYKKINVYLDFIGRGGMYSIDEQTDKGIELAPALDLNLKVDYFFSKPFSVFLKLENILSNNYPIYSNYKVRGFQLLVGANWSF